MSEFNTNHSANTSVTTGTYRSAAFGLHPDLDERIEEIRNAIPGTMRGSLNGWVALYAAENGVIYSVIVGTSCAALRLPPEEIKRALAEGAVHSVEGKRSKTNSETYKNESFEEPMTMGDDWVIFQNLWKFDKAWWLVAYDHTAKVAPEPIEEEAVTDKQQIRMQLMKGVQLRQQKPNPDLDEAIAQFTTIIGSNPTYLPAYFERADTYNIQGKLTEAIADVTRVIELDPTHYLAYHRRGDFHKAVGATDSALEDYQHAVKFMAHREFFYYLDLARIASMFVDRGDLDEAIAAYGVLIAEISDPGESAAYYQKRGQVYAKRQSYGEAIVDFEMAFNILSDLAAKKPNSGYGNANSRKHLVELTEEINRLKGLQDARGSS